MPVSAPEQWTGILVLAIVLCCLQQVRLISSEGESFLQIAVHLGE